MSDWLPSKRTERLAMAKTWSAMLTASGLSWGILEGEPGSMINNPYFHNTVQFSMISS